MIVVLDSVYFLLHWLLLLPLQLLLPVVLRPRLSSERTAAYLESSNAASGFCRERIEGRARANTRNSLISTASLEIKFTLSGLFVY